MRFVAGLLGLVFSGVYQALTGRWRATAAVLLGYLAWSALAFTWPRLALAVFLVPLASAVDATRAHAAGARASTKHLLLTAAAILVIGAQLQLIKRFLFTTYQIPSSSMMPTLAVGDRISVERLTLLWRAPERGEVVVFEWPPGGVRRIGRIVALGGDELYIREHAVSLRGRRTAVEIVGPLKYSDPGLAAPVEVQRSIETLEGHRYSIFAERDFARARAAYPSVEGGCEIPADPALAGAGVASTALQPNADAVACVVPPGTFFFLGDNRWNSRDSRYLGALPLSAIVGRVRGIWLPGAPALDERWSRVGRVP